MFHQDINNYDLLIINDGSTDNSLDVIKGFQNEQVIILSQENQGVSATRNRAMNYAQEKKYDAIAFLDADDYWDTNHLNVLISLFHKFPEAEVAGTNYRLKRSRKTLQTKFSNFKDQNNQLLKHFFEHNYLNSVLNCSNLMIKISAIEKVGYFSETVTHFEDIDWFIRIGINASTAFSFKTTTTIDEAAGNRSDQIKMKDRRLPDFSIYQAKTKNHKGLEKYLDLNRLSIALAYRMVSDIKNATKYQQLINLKNLSSKQQRLLKMSRLQLKSLKRTQKILGNLGLNFRAGN